MSKRVAITIAGAVSLGSYEAGVMYEVLDALAQHNRWADKNNLPDKRIEIDVLTGASAGGMTAAVTAFSLLFNGAGLSQPYNNPLYNAWVEDIDITALLARQPDEDVTHSVLSSDCVVGISRKYLAPTPPPMVPLPPPHPALSSNGTLHLGMALSNMNGVDYARPTMTNRQITYTQFADQYSDQLDLNDGYVANTWETIRATAVSCGAFPFAFSVQELVRNITDFLSSPFLVKSLWNGKPSMPFCYTDGGVFQNQPLGMAKNLVERLPDGRLNAADRGYLFIAPKPKTSDVNNGINKGNANFKATIFALMGAVIGQSELQDWVMAESVNDKIALLDDRAIQLKSLFDAARLNPAQTVPLTTALLNAFFAKGNVQGTLPAARTQLQTQYQQEYLSFNNPVIAQAWLDALLVLELAADLHEKEEMYIYDFVADPALLAGGQLFAFTGFFDLKYRQHDYDYGRSVAQQQIRLYMEDAQSIFSGLQWTPGHINPINPDCNNLPMTKVDEAKRKQVYNQIMDAVDSLLSELGTNWIERKAVEAFLIRKFVKQLLALS